MLPHPVYTYDFKKGSNPKHVQREETQVVKTLGK